MRDNVLYNKSLNFAIRIVKLYSCLKDRGEYIMSKQIMRSGTSIGANITEALDAQSGMDFVSKLSIALKECKETRYWLTLLHRVGILYGKEYDSLDKDASELNALLVSIIKTKKRNLMTKGK
ncbi:MAG: four helix bundle protein [Muribaculaceae bacterium]|nr:four helix bundle protein [Muribaculaceae bacterium]